MYYIGLNGERLVKERVSKEQVDELYKEYMDIYGEYIPEFIQDRMKCDYLDGLEQDEVPCYILQFYDEYNLMKKKYNYYAIFEDLIKRNYPDLKNKTILDMGGGIVPSLGRRLAKEAKHVIAVDRYISPLNNPNNLETIQCEIEDVKDLPKTDLVIGFMPCESTRLLIDYATYYNADFIMELCGCIHNGGPMNYDSWMYNNFYNYYVSDLCEETKQKIVDSRLGKFRDYGVKRLPYKVIGNKRV